MGFTGFYNLVVALCRKVDYLSMEIHNYYDLLVAENEKYMIQEGRDVRIKIANMAKFSRNGEPFKIIEQPMFYSPKDIDEFNYIAKNLFSIVDRIYELYLIEPLVKELYCIDENMKKWIPMKQDYTVNFPIARIDLFYDRDHNAKICELNADGSGGMFKDTFINTYINESKIFRDLSERYCLKYTDINMRLVNECLNIFENYLSIYSYAKKKEPVIAVMDYPDCANLIQDNYICDCFRSRGCIAYTLSPDDLVCTDDGVYYNSIRVDLIYKENVNETFLNRYAQAEKMLMHVDKGRVCLVGGIKSEVFDNKMLYAVLFDRRVQCFLSESDIAFIQRYIPFTFYMGDYNLELMESIISEKDRYVIKGVNSYSCKSVFVGREHSLIEWKELVYKLWNKGYIAQEFIDTEINSFHRYENGKIVKDEFRTIIGVFYFNNNFSGIYTRASSEIVISGSGTNDYTMGNIEYTELVN